MKCFQNFSFNFIIVYYIEIDGNFQIIPVDVNELYNQEELISLDEEGNPINEEDLKFIEHSDEEDQEEIVNAEKKFIGREEEEVRPIEPTHFEESEEPRTTEHTQVETFLHKWKQWLPMAYAEVVQNSRRSLLTIHYDSFLCPSFANALYHVFCSSAGLGNGEMCYRVDDTRGRGHVSPHFFAKRTFFYNHKLNL